MTALPDAPGAYGQPPRPPIDASKRVTPRSRPVDDVGERGAARVVEVQADAIGTDAGALERVEEIVDATRRRHAGGVAEREPVGPGVEQVAGELRDAFGRDVAFVRATERGRRRSPRPGHVAPCASSTRSRARDQRLGDERRTFFWLCVSLADTTSSSSSARACERELGALRVRHERGVDDARTSA